MQAQRDSRGLSTSPGNSSGYFSNYSRNRKESGTSSEGVEDGKGMYGWKNWSNSSLESWGRSSSGGSVALPPWEIVTLPTDVNSFIVQGPPMFPQPRILVIPGRNLNFTNVTIQFSVSMINRPEMINRRNLHFECEARSPSGAILPSMITGLQKNIPFSPLETFLGNFQSNDEVGIYKVTVSLLLPTTMCYITDTAEFLVSRNYLKDAKNNTEFMYHPNPHYDDNADPPVARARKYAGGGYHSGDESWGSKAWGLASDRLTDKIFYGDRATHTVYCLDGATKTVLYRLDHGRSKDSPLSRPTGIAVDDFNRRLIVSDKDNHRICAYTLDGQYIGCWGKRGHLMGEFNYPWDVDVDRSGSQIVVADSRNKRIQLFDKFGNYTGRFSVYEKDPYEYKYKFDYPRGISFNHDASAILVSDFNINNIVEIPRDLSVCRKLLTSEMVVYGTEAIRQCFLRRPQGLTVDEVGGILVCDSKNNCIRHFTMDAGNLKGLSKIQDLGGAGSLSYPVNITTLAGGKAAVLDGNGNVFVF